jgi:hypothetical protein
MEPEALLPHLQVPGTCPYPEPARSSPFPHIALPEDPSLPLPILRRTSSDGMIFLFRSDVGRRPTWFLLRLFARFRSLSDAFLHVVRTLANR